MKKFAVEKIEWEYGEKFGNVYYPKGILDLREKVQELADWGAQHKYPFLIAIHFFDSRYYLAFTVGHSYSFVEFAYKSDESEAQRQGPFYLSNKLGKVDEIIPIYYFSSYTEPDTTKMMPQELVLEAIYQFILRCTFPHYIAFDNDDVNQKFVLSG